MRLIVNCECTSLLPPDLIEIYQKAFSNAWIEEVANENALQFVVFFVYYCYVQIGKTFMKDYV